MIARQSLFSATVFSLLLTSAYAQAPERLVSTNPGFVIKTDWFDGAACSDGDKKLFHFQIGRQVFAVAATAVTRGRMGKIAKATQEKGSSDIKLHFPTDIGCKSSPVPFVEAELKDPLGVIVLSETPSRPEGMSPTARYIRHLGETRACRTTGRPDVLACAGSRTDPSGQTIYIVFLVVAEGGNNVNVPASGIPIHARCEGRTGLEGCYVSEELDNGVTVKSEINGQQASAQDIRKLHERLIDFAAKRRAI